MNTVCHSVFAAASAFDSRRRMFDVGDGAWCVVFIVGKLDAEEEKESH